ncbi:heterokaryon incompatibility protein-domain-containing protein [Lasiosphaeria ovina]|uniref:Heterokaryon incompatibility protein-domain-containing protein n=1 Tax=Lasiosphaeria ovina TaxID=92902 RepID=A0AAE0K4N6_9PEZI|nr:heterokaryon incompatibility protein-domain-containing protein [Lasiosphaeria ovina]
MCCAVREHHYSPLPDGYIRLLRLMPHGDRDAPIQFNLLDCPLPDSSQDTSLYDALSYVWGSPEKTRFVYTDECRLAVTVQLHTALSYLRDRLVERIIWIDAICINQEDNDEKGRQVQPMAKIYARASRVIVWLGEEADGSNEALREILNVANQLHTNSAIVKTNHQAIPPLPDQRPTTDQRAVFRLLERPWFQRIWVVLQEVAAARHVLIKCGTMEIDGYAFCSGISALKPYESFPELQSLIRSAVYLIMGAIFRPRCEISQSDRFSLNVRPLSELVDMYHTRKATKLLDKVYALLGMSSGDRDPYKAGFWPNYNASWKDVFQRLVKFSLSDKMSVSTWNRQELKAIQGNIVIKLILNWNSMVVTLG